MIDVYDDACNNTFSPIIVSVGNVAVPGLYYRFDVNQIYLVTGFTSTPSPSTFTFTTGYGSCNLVPPA